MIRQTSIDAYNTIKQNGLLSKRRWEVYSSLFNNGPMTTGEIWNKFFKQFNVTQNSINPRLSELKNLGVINEIGTKQCDITGMNVILWDVTDSLPSKLEKKKTKDQIIKELQEEVKQLKAKIQDINW